MCLGRLLVFCLNFITALLGGAIIGAGAWLYSKHNDTCISFLHWPIIVLGIAVVFISVMALLGAWFKMPIFMWIYLLCMFLLIAALLAFAIFSFVVTHTSAAKAINGVGIKQYKVGDFSQWLQTQVNNTNNWEKISACLKTARVCGAVVSNYYPTLTSFYNSQLGPLITGCCAPPAACGYQSSSGAWINPTNPNADPDCATYDNDVNIRCYPCKTCEAGVLQTLVDSWKKVAIVTVVAIGFLVVVYVIACHSK